MKEEIGRELVKINNSCKKKKYKIRVPLIVGMKRIVSLPL